MNNTQKVLQLNGRTITLIGTAHISKESIEEVTSTIKSVHPDCVAIELDSKREESIKNPDSWSKLDIIKVLKRGEGFLLLANLILSSFQKRMGNNVGVKPGDEMIAAINTANELNIPTSMVDRPIQITLKRAWAKNSLWGKCKLLASLIASAFSNEEISTEQVEELKHNSEMDSMMKELSEYMPTIKEVLIDERDQYLASHIWQSKGNNIVAVLGAGHLPGVESYLQKIVNENATTDTQSISELPKKKKSTKILSFLIPACIIILIGIGFYFGGKANGAKLLTSWVFWNGALAALGTLIACGNIVTILTALISAPLTSLCPFIGVGIVAGIVQASICKPKVSDMENLTSDTSNLKGYYKNRILKVLMVFIFSSIGSSLGTFISTADIVTKITQIFVS